MSEMDHSKTMMMLRDMVTQQRDALRMVEVDNAALRELVGRLVGTLQSIDTTWGHGYKSNERLIEGLAEVMPAAHDLLAEVRAVTGGAAGER